METGTNFKYPDAIGNGGADLDALPRVFQGVDEAISRGGGDVLTTGIVALSGGDLGASADVAFRLPLGIREGARRVLGGYAQIVENAPTTQGVVGRLGYSNADGPVYLTEEFVLAPGDTDVVPLPVVEDATPDGLVQFWVEITLGASDYFAGRVDVAIARA